MQKQVKKSDEPFGSSTENVLFELPPTDDLVREAWNEFAEVVDEVVKAASRSTDFEVVHALMVHFYNRKSVGRELEPKNAKIPTVAARHIERRMSSALGTAPSYKTIYDNFAVAPEDADRVARRLQRRQFMMAFFAQSCRAVDPARKPAVSQQELDRARQSLENWGIILSTEEVEQHLARACKVLRDEVLANASSRRHQKLEVSPISR
ncbi:hypothetical protein ACVINW_001436 [Bradyrhizobium sp. USDA 4461]